MARGEAAAAPVTGAAGPELPVLPSPCPQPQPPRSRSAGAPHRRPHHGKIRATPASRVWPRSSALAAGRPGVGDGGVPPRGPGASRGARGADRARLWRDPRDLTSGSRVGAPAPPPTAGRPPGLGPGPRCVLRGTRVVRPLGGCARPARSPGTCAQQAGLGGGGVPVPGVREAEMFGCSGPRSIGVQRGCFCLLEGRRRAGRSHP